MRTKRELFVVVVDVVKTFFFPNFSCNIRRITLRPPPPPTPTPPPPPPTTDKTTITLNKLKKKLLNSKRQNKY